MTTATTHPPRVEPAQITKPVITEPEQTGRPAKPTIKTEAIKPIEPTRPNLITTCTSFILALLGLAALPAGYALADRLGETERVWGFITGSPDYLMFSAVDGAYYPSVSGYLGVLFAGSAGTILGAALGLCTCLGLTSLWLVRRQTPGPINRGLPLTATLLLPLLTLNYMIFCAVEFTGAAWMPAVLAEDPAWLQPWVYLALASATVMSLTGDLLIFRWAWRREKRVCAARSRVRFSHTRGLPVTPPAGMTYTKVRPA